MLGDAYVDRATNTQHSWSEALQSFVNEFCWGFVWTRDGLPRQTRSLVNVAMLTALNRPEELKLHVHGAIRNGCTEAELVEVVMQVAVYAGLPAALDAFRTLAAVLAENENGQQS
ncbi:carboxymuconolactone decarboxylase family protein [Actinophytocola sp.]|uniref:carboxymuconolactone decarboxylase family protein n=1 Tax=Actinophytocola sp. TaxID=1872138 RepID=UPI003D6B68AF